MTGFAYLLLRRNLLLPRFTIVVSGLVLAFVASFAGAASEVDSTWDVAPVWAGHPVRFALLTIPPSQFVAYYDEERRMTVASRRLNEESWTFTRLDEKVGWDSHNSIEMVADDKGFLHLSGNMHVTPLKYFRTAKPLDATTFARISSMVGHEEERVTYPEFFDGPEGKLIFTYRDGSSGNGNQIHNVYDSTSQTWRRLLDKPLTDGEGRRNAYFVDPVKGPDGHYHLCSMWRETPDCATNHDLCYARSKDFVHWESSAGKPFTLPIRLDTAEIVDPIPEHGGLLNGNTRIGFDDTGRVIITYHKFDADGTTQLYNARLEDGVWKIYLGSHWDYRWDFSGGGVIVNEISVQPVKREEDGTLTQTWSHIKYGTQRWRLEPKDLKPIAQIPLDPSPYPDRLKKLESTFPGMEVHFASDTGKSDVSGTRYMLRWETLGPNRDKARDKPWPPPSMLCVYRIHD